MSSNTPGGDESDDFNSRKFKAPLPEKPSLSIRKRDSLILPYIALLEPQQASRSLRIFYLGHGARMSYTEGSGIGRRSSTGRRNISRSRSRGLLH